jgi:hypothetical protein
MSDTDEIATALHAVLDGFVAVCGAPDDLAVTTGADDALAHLDELIAASAAASSTGPAGRD